MKVPSSVDEIKFYVRFYYPETLRKILKSVPNKTRGHGKATEVWIGNKMVWRSSGKMDKSEYSWNTSSYHFDHTLYGKEKIIKALQNLDPGKSELIIWHILYFQESKPHPATGIPRFVDEKIYLSMGSLKINKQ
jgi:hypothetical protein